MWISKVIRSRCARTLAMWAFFAGLICACFLYHHRYFKNVWYGPYEFGPSQLSAVEDPATSPEYFVRVTGKRAQDTGLQMVRRKIGSDKIQEVLAGYFALEVGGKYLIVKREKGIATSVAGQLTKLPPEVEHKLFEPTDAASGRTRIYPLLLDSDEYAFKFEAYFAVFIVLVYLALFTWLGVPVCRQMLETGSHPVSARLAAWGNPFVISQEAEKEAAGPMRRVGCWSAGDNYLIFLGLFSFDLLRLDDVVWAYKEVITHKTNGLVTSVTHQLSFHCKNLKAIAAGRESDVDAMLAYIAGRCPWAEFGFSADLQSRFEQPNGLLVATIAARRKLYEEGNPLD
ncbi:MAG TPA: hypothetical protein VGJ26_21505 [Pirellulales bacterium]